MENSILFSWQTFKHARTVKSLAKKGNEVHNPVSFTLTVQSARMFLNLYGISFSRFRRLKEHYEEQGLSQRVHGNYKRLPHNTLPQAVTEDVKNFLSNDAEENAVLLPGRIPGFKNDDIRLLSSSETKMNVWRAFKTVCEATGKQVGTHDGKVIVPVYDWSAFLGQYFVKLPGIKKFHHFRFSKEEPGKIYFKEYSTSPERSLLLLKHPATLPPAVLPAKVNPQGLSQERKQYLHREIRQFWKPGTEDLVAPVP